MARIRYRAPAIPLIMPARQAGLRARSGRWQPDRLMHPADHLESTVDLESLGPGRYRDCPT